MKNINTMAGKQRDQSGFTLIELMIVMSMIAILSAIAIPSYKKYIRKNAESAAVAKVKSLELELERWRATALTYRGFEPIKSKTDSDGNIEMDADGEVTLTHGYDKDNKIIYVPEGSGEDDYLYQIILDDGTGRSLTTAATLSDITTTPTGVVGNAWRMIAVPNTAKSNLKRAEKYLITSRGMKCKTALYSVNFDSTQDAKTICGQSGVEKW